MSVSNETCGIIFGYRTEPLNLSCMKLNVFMKRLLFVLVLAGCCNALAAQTIRFKTDYTSTKSSSTLKFETASYSGSLSSSNTELVLKIKNKGEATWSSKQINLVDISNRGEKLCAEKELVLAPGKKGSSRMFRVRQSVGCFV